MSKPRCEDIGFEHAWEHPVIPGAWKQCDVTGMWGFPIRSEEKRVCLNCGRQEKKVFAGMDNYVPPGGYPIAIYKWEEVPPDANG